jgi:hypothetical protein
VTVSSCGATEKTLGLREGRSNKDHLIGQLSVFLPDLGNPTGSRQQKRNLAEKHSVGSCVAREPHGICAWTCVGACWGPLAVGVCWLSLLKSKKVFVQARQNPSRGKLLVTYRGQTARCG